MMEVALGLGITLVAVAVSAFLMWKALQGLSHPVAESAISIVISALLVATGLLFAPIIWIGDTIIHMTQRVSDRIKPFLYLLLGAGTFVADQMYNTKIFAEDEATFYKVGILHQVYWVTEIACWIGGIFIFCGIWFLVSALMRFFNRCLDRNFSISVVIYR